MFKLEAGKAYRQRNGEGPVVVRTNCHPIYLFESKSGTTYTLEGFVFSEQDQTLRDLVSLWEEPVCEQTEPVEEAKSYTGLAIIAQPLGGYIVQDNAEKTTLAAFSTIEETCDFVKKWIK